jgi:DNA-binding PadR family transcriptional regulator
MIEVVDDSEEKKIYGLTENGEYLLKALTDRD